MPHKCNHGHGHSHGAETDIWTKIATASALPQFISTLYWLARMFDIATGYDEDTAIGISWYALIFSAIAANLAAIGSTYCHYNLNLNNQAESSDDEEKSPLVADDDSDFDETPRDPRRLTLLQTFGVIGDFIAHVGEDAGPIGFVFDLATKNLDLPRWGVGIFYAFAALYGSLTAIADVRTCKKSIHDVNEKRAKSKDDTEYWCGFFPRKRTGLLSTVAEKVHYCWYTP